MCRRTATVQKDKGQCARRKTLALLANSTGLKNSVLIAAPRVLPKTRGTVTSFWGLGRIASKAPKAKKPPHVSAVARRLIVLLEKSFTILRAGAFELGA